MAGSQDFEADARNDDLVVLLDGQLVPAREARVSIFDAGFGLGDGVWEGLRLHQGSLLFLEAHLDRLHAGGAAIGIAIPPRDALLADMVRLLRANGMEHDAHVRLMVTRGLKRTINQDPRSTIGAPTVAITAEFKTRSKTLDRGLRLATVSIRTSPPEIFDMRLNSHSRLNYIRALLEAIELGADEGIMLDPNGAVASCNATNFFWVSGGVVHTSGDDFCFNGVTRGNVIEACCAGAAPLRQGSFPRAALDDAEEAFVTGTMGGITPVASIDGRVLSQVGGPMTQAVVAAYAAMKDAYAAGKRHL
ncbi:MAG: D-amino acid aminotransferase [Novosphingobium sp.]